MAYYSRKRWSPGRQEGMLWARYFSLTRAVSATRSSLVERCWRHIWTELSRLNHPRLGWECSEYTPALQNQASSWELNVPGKKSLTGKEEGRTDTVRHTTRVFSCFSSIADHQKQGFRLLETDQVAALYLQPLCLLWCLFHGIVKSFAADPVCIFSCFSLVLSAKIRKCSTILFLPQMSVCSLSCRSYSKQKLTHK